MHGQNHQTNRRRPCSGVQVDRSKHGQGNFCSTHSMLLQLQYQPGNLCHSLNKLQHVLSASSPIPPQSSTTVDKLINEEHHIYLLWCLRLCNLVLKACSRRVLNGPLNLDLPPNQQQNNINGTNLAVISIWEGNVWMSGIQMHDYLPSKTIQGEGWPQKNYKGAFFRDREEGETVSFLSPIHHEQLA